MKIHFWSIGKAHEAYVQEGIDLFTKRITHYYPVEWRLFPAAKSKGTTDTILLRRNEATLVLGALQNEDVLVILDERGKSLHSPGLAAFIQQKANESTRNLVFLIGGAYGVDESLTKRSQFIWSLSKLVFPHQLVRLILAEQIYRACTILRNEKYHHE